MLVGDTIGCCSNCAIKQRVDRCVTQKSAKLLICSGESKFTLFCFGSILSDIVESGPVSEKALLIASPFTMTFKDKILTGVRREN